MYCQLTLMTKKLNTNRVYFFNPRRVARFRAKLALKTRVRLESKTLPVEIKAVDAIDNRNTNSEDWESLSSEKYDETLDSFIDDHIPGYVCVKIENGSTNTGNDAKAEISHSPGEDGESSSSSESSSKCDWCDYVFKGTDTGNKQTHLFSHQHDKSVTDEDFQSAIAATIKPHLKSKWEKRTGEGLMTCQIESCGMTLMDTLKTQVLHHCNLHSDLSPEEFRKGPQFIKTDEQEQRIQMSDAESEMPAIVTEEMSFSSDTSFQNDRTVPVRSTSSIVKVIEEAENMSTIIAEIERDRDIELRKLRNDNVTSYSDYSQGLQYCHSVQIEYIQFGWKIEESKNYYGSALKIAMAFLLLNDLKTRKELLDSQIEEFKRGQGF